MSSLYLGLISGTSVDTVDGVIASFAPNTDTPHLLHAHDHPIAPRLRRDLLEVAADERAGLARIARLDVEVGHLFADAALATLREAGLDPGGITAVGSHGQTVRHEPNDSWPSTTQIGDPNIIAERTGITTVADFRRRDVAAGGQGAPLAPTFHQAVMSHQSIRRAVVNLGGIANISVLQPTDSVPSASTVPARARYPLPDGDSPPPTRSPLGFDCGPANGLLDAWARRHLDAPLDEGGSWAAQGTVHDPLLERMLAEPFFSMQPPKSTGRGHFDERWIDAQMRGIETAVAPPDVQRTLCELCAATVAASIETYGQGTEEVYLCGGGVHNRTLADRLTARLFPRRVARTDALGVPADHVEATAFAWLAKCALEGRPVNLPPVTGASRPVVLGGIWPGGDWPGFADSARG